MSKRRKKSAWVPPNAPRRVAEPTAAQARKAYIEVKVQLAQCVASLEEELRRTEAELAGSAGVIKSMVARITVSMDRADDQGSRLAAARTALKHHAGNGKRFELLRARAEAERLTEEIKREEREHGR